MTNQSGQQLVRIQKVQVYIESRVLNLGYMANHFFVAKPFQWHTPLNHIQVSTK
jgi:hypothetical protein